MKDAGMFVNVGAENVVLPLWWKLVVLSVRFMPGPVHAKNQHYRLPLARSFRSVYLLPVHARIRNVMAYMRACARNAVNGSVPTRHNTHRCIQNVNSVRYLVEVAVCDCLVTNVAIGCCPVVTAARRFAVSLVLPLISAPPVPNR